MPISTGVTDKFVQTGDLQVHKLLRACLCLFQICIELDGVIGKFLSAVPGMESRLETVVVAPLGRLHCFETPPT